MKNKSAEKLISIELSRKCAEIICRHLGKQLDTANSFAMAELLAQSGNPTTVKICKIKAAATQETSYGVIIPLRESREIIFQCSIRNSNTFFAFRAHKIKVNATLEANEFNHFVAKITGKGISFEEGNPILPSDFAGIAPMDSSRLAGITEPIVTRGEQSHANGDEEPENIKNTKDEWRIFIEAQKQIAHEKIFEAEYSSYKTIKRNDKSVTLQLTLEKNNEPIDKRILGISRKPDEQITIYKTDPFEKQNNERRILGTIDTYKKPFLTVTLKEEFAHLLKSAELDVPSRGFIRYEPIGEIALLKQQAIALESLGKRAQETEPIEKLIFEGKYEHSSLPTFEPVIIPKGECLNSQTINDEQLDCVQRAIATPDFFLLQGPPGTGKTTFISELSYQLVRRGKRVLITSQANLAVDNALSRLNHHEEIRAIRLGKEDRIGEEGKEFIGDAAVIRWIRSVESSVKSKLRHLENLDRFGRFFLTTWSAKKDLFKEVDEWCRRSPEIELEHHAKKKEVDTIITEINRDKKETDSIEHLHAELGQIRLGHILKDSDFERQWWRGEHEELKSLWGYEFSPWDAAIKIQEEREKWSEGGELAAVLQNLTLMCEIAKKKKIELDEIEASVLINKATLCQHTNELNLIKADSIIMNKIPKIEEAFDSDLFANDTNLKNIKNCFSVLEELCNFRGGSAKYYENGDKEFETEIDKFAEMMLSGRGDIAAGSINKCVEIFNKKIPSALERGLSFFGFQTLQDRINFDMIFNAQNCRGKINNRFRHLINELWIDRQRVSPELKSEINRRYFAGPGEDFTVYAALKFFLERADNNREIIESREAVIDQCKAIITMSEDSLESLTFNLNVDLGHARSLIEKNKHLFFCGHDLRFSEKSSSDLNCYLLECVENFERIKNEKESILEGKVEWLLKIEEIQGALIAAIDRINYSGRQKLEQLEKAKTAVCLNSEIIYANNRKKEEAIALWKRSINSGDMILQYGGELPDIVALENKHDEWEKEGGILIRKKIQICESWIADLKSNKAGSISQDLVSLFIRSANIVGSTCAYMTEKRRKETPTFDYVIIDEVSKLTPPEILMVALLAKRIVLIGDYNQLPPIVGEESCFAEVAEKLEKSKGDVAKNLTKSLFKERYLSMCNISPSRVGSLKRQYRMHSAIMGAINQFYEHSLVLGHEHIDIERQHGLSCQTWLAPEDHIIWIDVPFSADYGFEIAGRSRANKAECKIVSRIVEQLSDAISNQHRDLSVGVTSPYAAQVRAMRSDLNRKQMKINVRVETIDQFQGMERDVMIVSMVMNRPRENPVGVVKPSKFLQTPERLNVALSRSKCLLIIVGCTYCYTQLEFPARRMYRNVVDHIARLDGFRGAIPNELV